MIENGRIRIMIADDHPVVRAGLATLINDQSDMVVIAEASTGPEALEKFDGCHPDISLIDLRMPEMNGIQVVAALHEKVPEVRAVILSMFDGDENIYQSLRAGAKGYLRKDASLETLVDCIRTVWKGNCYIQPPLAEKLANRVAGSALSPRELDVLQLVVRGKINKEIADDLHISEGTVKIHLNHIMRKLGVRGRTEAANSALKRGIVQLD